jgi:phage tail sheath protein FI
MALLKSESPNVAIREVDLSGVVPGVTSSTGAYVGDFAWGPVNTPILVGNEAGLVNNFGDPSYNNDSSAIDFLSATQFLKYSTNMFVVRGATSSALNAVDSGSTTTLIENRDDWDATKSGASGNFIAKWAGTAGNSLKIDVCGSRDSAWSNWAYASNFDARPGTSSWVSTRSTDSALAKDEVHVAIIDEDGVFSGTPNTVLETFANLSLATDAKTEDGSTNYILDALSDRSEYVWGANHPSQKFGDASTAIDFTNTANGANRSSAHTALGNSFDNGANSGGLDAGDYATGFAQFEDENTIQVDFLIAPGMNSSTNQRTVVNDLVAIAVGRKDCMVVASPNRDAVVDVNNPTTVNSNITTTVENFTSSSYLTVDNNYLKVYDKYNDKYTFIPAASSTAGLMANTDDVSAPWFSPAGTRRGNYLGVTALAYNPSKAQRDTLYKAGVNPIVNLPGQGIVLYGDKTFIRRPSAFDRINVRRLFLVIERAIKGAAQNVLFEFNDEFTRAEFVNIIEPFLREVQGRRGITDFKVVCDDTNNTANVIDTNSFVASVFVKPARSINYVTLNFVGVRTGVDFEEVVGTV